MRANAWMMYFVLLPPVIHVDESCDGPGRGAEEGRHPAHHQVDPVVRVGVVQENVNHQDVVQV